MVSRYGTARNDSLIGTNSDDWLWGKEGNDTIACGAGRDWIYGGAGSDVVKLQPGQGGDKWLDFQDGIDKIDAGGLAFSDLRFSYEDVWKYVWVEDASHNKLLGIKNIRLSQLTADDFTNLAVKTATTAVKTLVMNGTAGSDLLTGSQANESIFGLGGNDSFKGGAGNDTISPGAGNDWIWTGAGTDVVNLQPGQGWDKWLDFQNGIDKIDAGGLTFGDLRFSYDSVWKYVWIEDSCHNKLLGIKNITLNQLTADDFVNLKSAPATTGGGGTSGSSGSSGSGGGTTTPSGTTDGSIAVGMGMKKLWEDDWAGKLARGDLDGSRFFDPYPGNYNWTSHNTGQPVAQTKSLVWTSEAWDRPNIGHYAAIELTTFKGVQGGYNAFCSAASYFDTGYDIMSVSADFYFPTSYKAESLTASGANIDTKGMFGVYASAAGTGKPGGPWLDPSVGFPPNDQNATWVDWGWKQKAAYGPDGYGNNNLRFQTGVTDLQRDVNGLDGKDNSDVNIPKGQWVHLEGVVQIDTNGHNGTTRLYQDGKLVSEVTGLDLGGAKYGWKLHGFFGTWMWGGAGDKYVSARTESHYVKDMSIYGKTVVSAQHSIAPAGNQADPDPFDPVVADARDAGMDLGNPAGLTAGSSGHDWLIDMIGGTHPADALLIA
ncbi:hypothetical protein DF3PB_2720002 [uncultured Defluviicoccus sp.]|uniref:Uncharacterized protein n=1 Tax=metagenome TaxID=256318 RepID=A0A380TE86_9ZZZZ|nr:hypothetical protein DF3PB_2720002 [uncultured Defluviicoccus sp.]